MELLASLGGEEAALQQAFFLSVSPKSFLQSLLRGQVGGVRPLVPLFFPVSFLKYIVHHLGSVCVTKNSPGIS